VRKSLQSHANTGSAATLAKNPNDRFVSNLLSGAIGYGNSTIQSVRQTGDYMRNKPRAAFSKP
jgi:hypothetical protein